MRKLFLLLIISLLVFPYAEKPVSSFVDKERRALDHQITTPDEVIEQSFNGVRMEN